MPDITQSRLKELLHYNPSTGIFTWIKKSKKSTSIGSIAGTKHNQGYWMICIARKRYLAHRLAWLYEFGVMPDKFIDHINRDKLDNRISNLRIVTRSENQQNHKKFKTNTSGASGVYWSKKTKRWNARIWVKGKAISLGYFRALEEAKAARGKAEKEYYSLPD